MDPEVGRSFRNYVMCRMIVEKELFSLEGKGDGDGDDDG